MPDYELTRALAFAIAEEGTSLLNEPLGSGKSLSVSEAPVDVQIAEARL